MSKNRLTLIMMTLLTVSALGGVIFAHGQVVDENKVPAETLLSMLEDSESEVSSLFETLVNDGGVVPEDALEALVEAQQLRAEAQGLYDEGKYPECIEKATEALNKYGEALDKAVVAAPEATATEPEEDETEKMVGLFTAISKSRIRIMVLLEIADSLDTQGVDTVDARELLATAEETLDGIQASLESGDFMEQDIVLGEANSLIGQATGLLKNKGEPMKQEKIERFIAQTRSRAGQLNKKMVRIFNHRGISDTDDISGEFDGIIAGLEDLDTKNDLKQVVNRLKLLVKNTNNVGKNKDGEESLFDDESIEAINTQTKMESRIERYKDLVAELDGSEEFKLDLSALLDEAEGLLAQAEEAMGFEDEALAEDLTDAADDILDSFDELIDEAEKESKDKGKSGAKFDAKLEEVNEAITELESHIAGIEDEGERASFENRLDEIRSKRDEAATEEDLDEIEDLLEQLEEDFGIENSSGKNDIHDNGKDKTKDDSGEPEDPEAPEQSDD